MAAQQPQAAGWPPAGRCSGASPAVCWPATSLASRPSACRSCGSCSSSTCTLSACSWPAAPSTPPPPGSPSRRATWVGYWTKTASGQACRSAIGMPRSRRASTPCSLGTACAWCARQSARHGRTPWPSARPLRGGNACTAAHPGRCRLEAVLREFVAHYNAARPPRALDLRPPLARRQPVDSTGEVVRQDRLGGLIHEYVRAAAGALPAE